MSLKDQISEDIKTAMKARDRERLETLRYVKKLLIENETSGQAVPELDVVVKYQKQLRNSLSQFPEASEHYTKTEREIQVLGEYLPQPLTEEEVVAKIDKILAEQAGAPMGAVMKALNADIKGRFDGRRASELVKSKLV